VQGGVAYLVAIIFIALALNVYFTFRRISRSNKRIKKGRVSLDEEKQAIWRDKEIARRIAREQEDAVERVNLRNETLAYYEEVRRRHAGDSASLRDSGLFGEISPNDLWNQADTSNLESKPQDTAYSETIPDQDNQTL